MITPFFELDQNDNFVIVKLKIPNLKFNNQNLSLTIDDHLLIFSLSPYYLRLKFQQKLLNEDDMAEVDPKTGEELLTDERRRKSRYDINSEMLILELPKATVKEYFSNLEYPHKLMSNAIEVKLDKKVEESGDIEMKEISTTMSSGPGKESNTKIIEEIDLDSEMTTDELKKHIEKVEQETGKEFNWQFKQKMPVFEVDTGVRYGFKDFYHKLVSDSIASGENDLNELTDPEKLTEDERIVERRVKENYGFNEDYYVSNYLSERYGDANSDDNYDYVMLQKCISWENPIKKEFLSKSLPEGSFPDVEFSKELKQLIINLPTSKVLHLVDFEKDVDSIYYLVTSLIFAYNLSLRLNCGDEENVDTAWLIGKICPQFACLDNKFSETTETSIKVQTNEEPFLTAVSTKYSDVHKSRSKHLDFPKLRQLIDILVKRSLIYPLFRSVTIIKQALQDVSYTFKFGLKKVIQLLFTIREYFRKNSHYQVYNTIWLNDLLSFLLNNVGTDCVNNSLMLNLSTEISGYLESFDNNNIVFEKIDPEADEMLDVTSIAQLDLIAEELYKDSLVQ